MGSIKQWSKWTKNLLLCLQGKNYSIKRDLIKVISMCVVGSLLVMAIPFFFRILVENCSIIGGDCGKKGICIKSAV